MHKIWPLINTDAQFQNAKKGPQWYNMVENKNKIPQGNTNTKKNYMTNNTQSNRVPTFLHLC